jgi:hypothetical protein
MRIIRALAPVALLLAMIPAVARADDVTVVRMRNLAIPVSTGGVLRGDLYQPKIGGTVLAPLPTVIIYFPYAKDDQSRFERTMLARLVQNRFAGLLVDIRGTGDSPGEFGLLSEKEIREGYDVVEWTAAQSWSDGTVGLWGYSYPGITAALIAALHPPHLAAIVPGAAYNDPYRDILFPGGIRATQDSGLAGWFAAHAMMRVRPDDTPAEALANVADAAAHPGGLTPIVDAGLHTMYDGWWRERELVASEITVPALFWSGWDDVYPRGQLLNYVLAGTAHKAIVMGPWGHIGGATGKALDFFITDSIRWFDIFLRTPDDERAGKLAAVPPVRLFDVDWTKPVTYDGAYHGTWRGFSSWPAHADITLQLCTSADGPGPSAPWLSRGALARACDVDGSVPVAGVPVDATGGVSVTHDTAKGDWANGFNDPKDARLDPSATMLVGAPLEQVSTITGPIRADLWATTQGPDADWVVRLVDIGPDAARYISQGWLRASHRHEDASRGYLWHTHDREEVLVPGEPYRFSVEVWPTSYAVPAGHRIGLEVLSADTMKVAGQTTAASALLVGPDHPSSVTLPIRSDDGAQYEP